MTFCLHVYENISHFCKEKKERARSPLTMNAYLSTQHVDEIHSTN